tara:strand:+ start:7071 stop:7223 length:153 start_codon:yes stop_codon:yes gene_type:complete
MIECPRCNKAGAYWPEEWPQPPHAVINENSIWCTKCGYIDHGKRFKKEKK